MKTIEINNKHYIDANVVMLQCKDDENASPSALYLRKSTNQLHYEGHVMTSDTLNQHLYITSNEEIKEGDYFIYPTIKGLSIAKHDYTEDITPTNLKGKKIIATTDSSLTIEITKSNDNIFYIPTTELKSLPQPSKEFIQSYIEFYNKGEVITDVLVEVKEICHKCHNLREDKKCCSPVKEYHKNNYVFILKLKDNTIIIKEKEDSWDYIFNTSFKDKRTTRYLLEQYLKENYYPPIKK